MASNNVDRAVEQVLCDQDTVKMAITDDTVQVKIPSLARYIGVARQAVDAVGEQVRLSPDERAAVRLAVGEACNNAVFYAHPKPDIPVGCVVVACRVHADALEIDVTNEGNGFHPDLGQAMPDVLAEHGRGMVLMEMLMDSVEYLSEQGNTVVRMRKRLRTPAPPETAAAL